MAQKRTNKKLITFSDRNLDMMEAIMAQTGWSTPTEIVKRGLEELYKSTFKYGADPLNSIGGIGTDIESQAKRKVLSKEAQKKAAQDLKDAPKIAMCLDVLGGEIVTQENGSKICKWENYSTFGKPEPQSIPIHQVGEYLLNSLFIPDRESVLKAHPELKTKFKKSK